MDSLWTILLAITAFCAFVIFVVFIYVYFIKKKKEEDLGEAVYLDIKERSDTRDSLEDLRDLDDSRL